MNQKQYNMVAERVIRSDNIRSAAFDVIFKLVTPYRAERTHDCPPGTVGRAVRNVKDTVEFCKRVASAE